MGDRHRRNRAPAGRQCAQGLDGVEAAGGDGERVVGFLGPAAVYGGR
jgi:hypothetical protein